MKNKEPMVTKTKEKIWSFLFLILMYIEGITEEYDVIKGITFFLFKKQLLTVAVCNNAWVDEQNKPYRFKVDGNMLFIHKLAIRFGN